MTPAELADKISATLRFLAGRKGAYSRVFPADSRDARLVLADLAQFCRANASTFAPDPHVAARLDGRREVWLRIANHLNLPTDELYRLFGGPQQEG